jgi:hypothetical protein
LLKIHNILAAGQPKLVSPIFITFEFKNLYGLRSRDIYFLGIQTKQSLQKKGKIRRRKNKKKDKKNINAHLPRGRKKFYL